MLQRSTQKNIVKSCALLPDLMASVLKLKFRGVASQNTVVLRVAVKEEVLQSLI